MTDKVTSADGSTIAYESAGDGRPVVLIGGAFNDRSTVAGLGRCLGSPAIQAVWYDRRGRGESTDEASAFAVEREIEDLAALIAELGGSAALFGHSSGAVLALEAAMRGLDVTALMLYEPPYIAGEDRPRPTPETVERLEELVRADRRDEAARLFLTGRVGVPEPVVDAMAASDTWRWMTGLAHSLPYDVLVCGPRLEIPRDRMAALTMPTLVVDGEQTWPWMRTAAAAVAESIPGARHTSLPGQDHGVLNQPEALAPLLVDFLG
jgi:pimeloyl-ACP methyl ester carboxylesterase